MAISAIDNSVTLHTHVRNFTVKPSYEEPRPLPQRAGRQSPAPYGCMAKQFRKTPGLLRSPPPPAGGWRIARKDVRGDLNRACALIARQSCGNLKHMKTAFPKIPIINIKKYGGRQVAVVRGKIVASGSATPHVLAKAKSVLPAARWKEIVLVSVPKGLTVVYRV